MRWKTVTELDRLGPNARQALDALRVLASADPSETFRKAAATAIQRIGGR